MPSAAYLEYLESPEWQQWRSYIKARDGYACQDCGTRHNLHVHHMTYARFKHERHTDLITVCNQCHKARHTYWWVRIPGGTGNGHPWTCDYLGPQTEWRARQWGNSERLQVPVDPDTPGLTYREQAWHADIALQREYAAALAKAHVKPDPYRPVRTAGRLRVVAPVWPTAPHTPTPAPRKVRRRWLRRLKATLITLGVLFLVLVVLASVDGNNKQGGTPARPHPVVSHR